MVATTASMATETHYKIERQDLIKCGDEFLGNEPANELDAMKKMANRLILMGAEI